MHEENGSHHETENSDQQHPSAPAAIEAEHPNANQSPSTAQQEHRDMNRFEKATIGLAIVGTLLAIGTAVIFHNQFQEMASQTNLLEVSARQARRDSAAAEVKTQEQLARLEDSVREAQKSNTIAIASNRPWIGVTPRQPGEPDRTIFDIEPGGVRAFYIWDFRNAGRRPGRVERVRTTGSWDSIDCTETPNYGFKPAGTMTPPFMPKDGRSFVLPESVFHSMFQTWIPLDKWELINNWQLNYCIYSSIEYRDSDYPRVLHHARDCKVFAFIPGQPAQAAQCSNGYASAD